MDPEMSGEHPRFATEPLYLGLDPVGILPPAVLDLIGRVMAWSCYVEFDLFQLYAIAVPNDLVARRREFYGETLGMAARIRKVRNSYQGRLEGDLAKALHSVLDEAQALATFRNNWAHNPLFVYGPDRQLAMLKVASGDFAGDLEIPNLEHLISLLPNLQDFHRRLTLLIGLLGNPTGGHVVFAFGPVDATMAEQIRSLTEHGLDALIPESGREVSNGQS
jgi:hypothetical protein